MLLLASVYDEGGAADTRGSSRAQQKLTLPGEALAILPDADRQRAAFDVASIAPAWVVLLNANLSRLDRGSSARQTGSCCPAA
jgi:hypothetical protein